MHSTLGEGILDDDEVSIEKAKKLLNTYFFKNKKSIGPMPSFRLLISPFMKRGAYAFNNLYKTHAVENNISTQLKNSFLLDMETNPIYDLKTIIQSRDQYLKLKEVKESDFVWEKKTINELKKEISTMKKSIDDLNIQLKKIIVNVENQEIINTVDSLNDNINNLTKRKYYLKNIISVNRDIIENNKLMSNDEIERIMDEAKFLTNIETIKTITDVQNFHKKLILFRTERIKKTIQKNIEESQKIENELDKLYSNKEYLQQQLENNKYLKKIYNLNKEISQKNIELEKLEKQSKIYSEINEMSKSSAKHMKTTMEKMKEQLPSKKFEVANSLFKKYTKKVFNDNGSLNLLLKDTGEYSSRGYRFEWKISRKSSSGYLKGCISIYDLILVEINSYLNTLFLIHDSPVFESTDKSYVANLLNIIFLSTQKNNFQYVCCLNEDQIVFDELNYDLQKIYKSNKNILSQESPLFGMSFSK